jgi:hypothetical protein
MSYLERRTVYFEAVDRENTEVLLRVVKGYAEEANIKDIVVASTTGETGEKASKLFKGCSVVVVTHHAGFANVGTQELKGDKRRQILANNARILTATHALSGVERSIRRKFGTMEPLELIANTLRLFGEGTKVCVEIVLMAADAGLIPFDKNVVAVAGSGRGADTALLIKPANSSRFFDLEIKEVIAKPRSLS